MQDDGAGETRALRSVLRDLVALSVLPMTWIGTTPTVVAAALADTLIELLQLDFIFVRLRTPGDVCDVDVVRGCPGANFPDFLESHLATAGWLPGMEIVPDLGGDVVPGRAVVVVPVGMNAGGGVVAAASDRVDFPTETDRLLLRLAVNHAATAFQGARLVEERTRAEEELRKARNELELKVVERTAELRQEAQTQLWFLESLDRIDRAIQGSGDLERMARDVLDAVLVTFGCDRAWLIHPCDPNISAHQVRMERATPEYVGSALGTADIPELASVFRSVLTSSVPVSFDLESKCALPVGLAERFGTKSMIAMAVYPRVTQPYMFGLHQCSHARIWTPHEVRLFHEIGRRLGDALNIQLMVRDLRESEQKLERSRAELAASRSRIVTAADETRRRIERDLHDGVQQRLVSLALAQQGAEAMVPLELPELRAELSNVAAGLASALEELREIARGIHPAVLSHGGLAPALKSLARRAAVPVELEIRTDVRPPESLEVAIYYIVSEALTNTAKHARASVVRVALDAHDGVIDISIQDDGCGGADPTRGSGLIGLADRIDALGGTIEVASPVGQGTELRITLPIREG
jgi:signal transduction histidine kinase